MDNPLVGICLVGEAESSSSHVIGVVTLPPQDRSQSLTTFRQAVNSALPLNLTLKHYVFLTVHGWEINENLEGTVKVVDVLSSEGLVKIRISYQQPKIGIVIEGRPDIALGFVFCELHSTVKQLAEQLRDQLPALYQSLSSTRFCFLDRNGWPISKEQEGLVTLFEVASSHTVKIRHFKQARKPSTHGYASDRSLDLALPSIASHPMTPMLQFSSESVDYPAQSLTPITETVEMKDATSLEQSMGAEVFHDSLKQSFITGYSCEILISYVHTEASDHALLLKEALEKLGYSVFLDVHCIHGGVDWQDALNDAISNCSLFIPLITLQYGETLWTNREVKLADVLGKIIIPVNCVDSWPPKCLAIQFAATQFIPWKKHDAASKSEYDETTVEVVANDIANRYQQKLKSTETIRVEITRQDSQATEILDESEAPTPLTPPTQFVLMKKRSSVRSYASMLPESVPLSYRKSIQESRVGKPLVVFCCHSSQREFAQGLGRELEGKSYEVWSTCSLDGMDEEQAREIFQQKADEAGVVVFILSKEFSSSGFCKQQVYYCEQRKRIIPLIYEPIQLPNWMAMLIGTSTFIDCRASSYKTTFLERIKAALNPKNAEQELEEMLQRKLQLAKMCSELASKLPKGKHVYISGGTKFFSSCGEEICKELGRRLAQDPEIILVTGGFYGVGETVGRSFHDERVRLKQPHGICHVIAVRDDMDRSNQTRQNPDGTFPPVPYGDTLFFGDSVRQRETLTPKVLDLCILVEGGPGAAFEAQQFTWNGHRVLPVRVTGGAAGGFFNIPQACFQKPPNVSESDWAWLGDEKATPTEIAGALARIVQVIKCGTGRKPRMRKIAKALKIGAKQFQRSETMPVDDSDGPPPQPMKRTFSESSSPPLQQKSKSKSSSS